MLFYLVKIVEICFHNFFAKKLVKLSGLVVLYVTNWLHEIFFLLELCQSDFFCSSQFLREINFGVLKRLWNSSAKKLSNGKINLYISTAAFHMTLYVVHIYNILRSKYLEKENKVDFTIFKKKDNFHSNLINISWKQFV